MKRPLLVATIAYINGFILGVYFKKSIPFIMVLLIIFTFLIIVISKKIKIKNKLSTIILYVIILSISSTYITNLNEKYNTKYYKFNNTDVEVIGTIVSDKQEKEYKEVYIIKVEEFNKSKKYKGNLLILNIKKSKDNKENSLNYGDKIKFKATYKEPSKARNYKGFDYKEYLKTKKIYGILKCDYNKNVEKLDKNNLNFLQISSNKFINKLKQNLQKVLPQKEADLAIGILTGYDEQIDEETIEKFRKSNLSHILAVSGTHIAYVILSIQLLFSDKIFGKNKKNIIEIIILIIFMNITGNTPSVIRASASYMIYAIASILHRKADIVNVIIIPALITLIINPFNVLNIGMQLSYAGTIGIILFSKSIENLFSNTQNEKGKIKKIKNYILNCINITVSANIFIIPLMLYHFNTISLTFILSNILASPLLGAIMLCGIFTLIISFISVGLIKPFTIVLEIFLKLLNKVAETFSSVNISQIILVTPSLYMVICIYIIEILIYWLYINKQNMDCIKKYIKDNFQKISLIFMLVIIVIILFYSLNTSRKPILEINFLDVGQGDSCLIKTNAGSNILIDGGGSKDSSSFDVGKQVLLPYLLDKKIKCIDYIIISHFDEDHAQGLESVLNTIKVRKVIISKQASISEEYKKIIKICNQKRIKILIIKRGDKIQIDNNSFFDILHPSDKFIDDGKGGLNANAIVAKFHYKFKNKKEVSMLFTGDIELKSEEELIEEYGEKLKSDILKVAHHGSKTSSSEEFLKKVKPKIALIGVGENNTFGHPNQGVLERIEGYQCKIYRTDNNGEISIKIYKNEKITINKKIN